MGDIASQKQSPAPAWLLSVKIRLAAPPSRFPGNDFSAAGRAYDSPRLPEPGTYVKDPLP